MGTFWPRMSGDRIRRPVLCRIAVLTACLITYVESQPRHCISDAEAYQGSIDRGGQQNLLFVNDAGMDVTLWWVDNVGNALFRGILGAGYRSPGAETSYDGHVFNVRSLVDDTLLVSHMMDDSKAEVRITNCGKRPSVIDTSRWAEFEALAADQKAPCEGPSSSWSCVRWVTPEELAARNPQEYGFHIGENPSGRAVGEDVDTGYTSQQPYIPNVTNYDGGYLKMSMTNEMKRILFPWYHDRRKDSSKPHGVIAGGYTNSHVIDMYKINLDEFPEVFVGVVKEMSQVLQWWTRQQLRHTSTFGVRIYHRGSMLVNHLDRMDTHIASAVLQLGQVVDDDGGWPLEVIHPHHPGRKEVYLQPGEMVLYEGGRLQHGRPMRLKGEEFANVFTHFAPLDWSSGAQAMDGGVKNPHFDRVEL